MTSDVISTNLETFWKLQKSSITIVLMKHWGKQEIESSKYWTWQNTYSFNSNHFYLIWIYLIWFDSFWFNSYLHGIFFVVLCFKYQSSSIKLAHKNPHGPQTRAVCSKHGVKSGLLSCHNFVRFQNSEPQNSYSAIFWLIYFSTIFPFIFFQVLCRWPQI